MNEEKPNQAALDDSGTPPKYEAPKIVRVSLRPEEAVLGHCKIPGSAGPVSASCTSTACMSFGS
jgi:hypothetical protein